MDRGIVLERVERLAQASLPLWPLAPDARVRLLNVSENATFLVEDGAGVRHVLRIHRDGYNSRAAIASELAWLDDIARSGHVVTPRAVPGRDGATIQEGIVEGLARPRRMVLFDFIEGEHPDESQDLVPAFRRLGAVSARLHAHTARWTRPPWFERLVWVPENVFGPDAYWGDWRKGPGVEPAMLPLLEHTQRSIVERLAAYGRSDDRFGLAHCDLRLANLLVKGDSTRVIDFDDCGLSWFLYDLAAALTVIDDVPQTPAWVAAWLEGYLPLRPLAREDLAVVPTLLMLRRMAILAWMGSHPATDLAQAARAGYAEATCRIAEAWLANPADPDDPVPWRR